MKYTIKAIFYTIFGFSLLLTVESQIKPSNQITPKIVTQGIDVYQQNISPLLNDAGVKCRFKTSCSQFSQNKVQKHGTIVGAVETIERLWRGYNKFSAQSSDGLTDKEREKGEEAAAACCGSMVIMIIVMGIALIINIAILVWVYKDAQNRGESNAILWMVIVFFTGIFGLIIWLLARPSGSLEACKNCGNKKLQSSLRCPHCGFDEESSSQEHSS